MCCGREINMGMKSCQPKTVVITVVISLIIITYILSVVQDVSNAAGCSHSGKEQNTTSIRYDYSGPSHTPWTNTSCTKHITRFGVGLSRVWMASFPCSGNTWARYLLEGATGVFTGSLYADRDLYGHGFLGELEDLDSGRTVVQKTHGNAIYQQRAHTQLEERNRLTDPNIPTILIIRNPIRAIVSFRKFQKAAKDKHLADIQDSSFTGKDFRTFVGASIKSWEEVAVDRLLWSKQLMVLHYEDLQRDPLRHVMDMLRFIGLPIDEDRLTCLSRHSEGSFHRSDSDDSPQQSHAIFFTDQEVLAMRLAALRINRILFALGHPTLPLYQEYTDYTSVATKIVRLS